MISIFDQIKKLLGLVSEPITTVETVEGISYTDYDKSVTGTGIDVTGYIPFMIYVRNLRNAPFVTNALKISGRSFDSVGLLSFFNELAKIKNITNIDEMAISFVNKWRKSEFDKSFAIRVLSEGENAT